MGESNSLVT